LLHRHLPTEEVIAGITAALRISSVNPDVVAVEARKSAHPDGPTPLGLILPRVVDLQTRRVLAEADLPIDDRGMRSVAAYDDLLSGAAQDHQERCHRAGRGRGHRRRLPHPAPAHDPARFAEIAATAEREQLSYLGFLAELVMAECDDRDTRRAVRRMNAAGFPRDKRIDEFDFTANPNVAAPTIHQLTGCGWVENGQPLCLIGDSGTGKTHLLIALGTAAAQAATDWPTPEPLDRRNNNA